MNYRLNEVLDQSDVGIVMTQLARKIYSVGFPLALVAILKGGAYTAYEVLKLLDSIYKLENQPIGRPDIVIGHIGLESYGDEMKSRSEVKLMTPLDLSRDCIRGRRVVIIDDCIETGNTLEEAIRILLGYHPMEIHTAVLVDKVTLREEAKAAKPDIVGWTYTGNGFLVGCGMGDGEKYRGLPEICEVVEN